MFLIVVFGGLRSLTAAGITAWVIVFTLLALAELIADKLPKTPSRTASPGLIARIVLGRLWGLRRISRARIKELVGCVGRSDW